MKQTNHFVPGQDGRLSAWAIITLKEPAGIGGLFLFYLLKAITLHSKLPPS